MIKKWLSEWPYEIRLTERFSVTTLDKKTKQKQKQKPSDSRSQFLNIEKEQIRIVHNNSYE